MFDFVWGCLGQWGGSLLEVPLLLLMVQNAHWSLFPFQSWVWESTGGKTDRASKGELLAKLPGVMWMGWTRAGLLVPTFQQILPSAACAEPDFICKSLFLFQIIPGQCQFKAASALWGVFDTPGLGPLSHWALGGLWGEVGKISFRNKLQYLQRIGSTGNAFVPKSQERFGQWHRCPWLCEVCALGSCIPLLLAILGIYSMSGLSEFVEVHIFFFFQR